MVLTSDIQHNRLRGEKLFQTFCLKLVKAHWKDEYAQEFGRRGQRQDGVDILGCDHRGGHQCAAVQCKGSETNDPRELTETEIAEEVERAKKFEPKLNLLIIAYSGFKDAALQKKAKALSEANEAAGLFRVVLWAWEDIVQEAAAFPEVIEFLLVQNKVGVAPQLSPRRPKADKSALLEHLQNAISAAQAVTEDAPEIAVDDPVAQAKIDVLRDQIRGGNGRNVVQPLKEFLEDLPAGAAPRIRLRAYANLGAALTQSGLYNEATIAFDNAAEAEPGSADGHAYAAKAALFRGKRATAYEQAEIALSLDPKQKLAASILVDTAAEDVETSDLVAKIGLLNVDGDVGYSLSRRYADKGAFASAIDAARTIESSKENWVRNVAVGEAILRRFERDLDARIGAPLSADSETLLQEAKTCLEKAWDQVRSRTDKKNWAFVGAHLSAVLRLLGDDERADDLAIEALGLSPDSRPLMERAALAFLHKGDGPRAAELSIVVAETGGAEEALFAASIAASNRKWQHVWPWAQKAFDEAVDAEVRARAAELLILAKSKQESPIAALTLADQLRKSVGAHVTFEARVTELAKRSEVPAHLNAARNRLANFDRASLNAIQKFELASALADDEQWAEAADLLTNLHSLERPSEILTRRLFALYRANRRTEARDLYKSLGKGALQSKEIRRLGAAIFERCGMLQESLKELNAAIALDSDDLRSRLDWARLSLRSNNDKAIAQWLKTADLSFNAPPEDKMELAQLLDRMGKRKDALRIGYETLRKNWGVSERLHMMYMSLFLLAGKRNETFLRPKEVSIDSVVFLQNQNGVKTSFRIESIDEVGEDVLPPDHAFARELLGAVVGEVRTAQAGIGQQPVWKIIEIKHKYLDLFHRVIEVHPTLFPGSTSLGSFNIDPSKADSFEPVFEQVRERARFAEEVVKLYSENLLPVDTVAKMLGIDSIDASLGIRFKSAIKLDVCVGTAEERDQTVNNLSKHDRIIVDPQTIATWNEIGLLEVLGTLQGFEVMVVQSTIDALTHRADEADRAIKQGGGSLEMVGDKIALIEHSKVDLKANSERWKGVEKWVRENATVVPTDTIAGVSEDKIQQVLSRATFHSIGTAAKGDFAYVCDDRRVRVLAASSGVKYSGWTQAFLMSLLNRDLINHNQYAKFVASLCRQRMGFVSVGQEDVLAVARTPDDFDIIIRALTGPNVDPRSIVDITLGIIVSLWSSAEWTNDRDKIVNRVLHELVVQRPDDSIQLLRIIFVKASREIRAFPFPKNFLHKLWSDFVDGFVQGHFLKSVINGSSVSPKRALAK